MLTKDSAVLFATFSLWSDGKRMPTNGNLEPLRDFLVSRVRRLVLIDQVHPGSESVMPKIEIYEKDTRMVGEQKSSWWMYMIWPLLKLTNKNKTQIFFKLRDFFSIFDLALHDKTHFNFFIGMECVNTLAGIVLRHFHRVDTVIYYVLDYSPNRYHGIMNRIYLALDRFCAMHADYIWDVSLAMQPARIASGLDVTRSAPVVHVPIGVFPDQIRTMAPKDIKPYSLVFLGTLGEENGPDLAISIMPIILEKYPTATLHIIGGGQKNLERLKTLCGSHNLADSVIFYGFVVKNSDMAKILSTSYIALAPYRAFPNSIRYYADASKMRSYAAAGLPIVTTDVPPLGKELQKLGGAIIAPDNEVGFSNAVLSLFSDPELYARMRKQVIKFAKDNTWDNEFSNAFSKSR